jgi:hypothetical protein
MSTRYAKINGYNSVSKGTRGTGSTFYIKFLPVRLKPMVCPAFEIGTFSTDSFEASLKPADKDSLVQEAHFLLRLFLVPT